MVDDTTAIVSISARISARCTLSSVAWSGAISYQGGYFWRNVLLQCLRLEYSCQLVVSHVGAQSYLNDNLVYINQLRFIAM